jgi:hypothetical protein
MMGRDCVALQEDVMLAVKCRDRVVCPFFVARSVFLGALLGVLIAPVSGTVLASQSLDVSRESSQILVKDWVAVQGEELRSTRDLSDCTRKPKINDPCGACKGIGVYEKIGPDCVGCGFFCTRIPYSQGAESRNLADEQRLPPYAVIVEETDPRSCVDGESLSEGPIRAAISNPDAMLEGIEPFALEIDRESFRELAITHPAAAYALSQRLLANGLVVVAPDMHFRESRGLSSAVTTEYLLDWMDDPEGAEAKLWRELPNGETFQYRYGTQFEKAGAWKLIVESWIEVDGRRERRDYKKSEVSVDSHPVGYALVQASNGFEAPVYAVQGFRVYSEATH